MNHTQLSLPRNLRFRLKYYWEVYGLFCQALDLKIKMYRYPSFYKDCFPLLEEMPNLQPLEYSYGYPIRERYWVPDTLLIIEPKIFHYFDSKINKSWIQTEGKYLIWERQVLSRTDDTIVSFENISLEQLIDTYPESVVEIFLYNMNLFKVK